MSFKFNFAVGGDSAAAAVGGGPGQPAAAAELRPCVEVFPDEVAHSYRGEGRGVLVCGMGLWRPV